MIDITKILIPVWLILLPCPHHPGDVQARWFPSRAACVAAATKLHLDPSACLRATEPVR